MARNERRGEIVRTHILLLISIPFLIFGCSHTYRMGRENPDEFYERINQKCEGKKGQLLAYGNREISGKNIYVKQDSTKWIDPEDGWVYSISTSDVTSVKIKKASRGALEGVGIGFLSGLAIGVLSGFALGDDPEGGLFVLSFTAEQKAAGLGSGLGLLGAIIGLPVGAAIGSNDVFLFSEQEETLYKESRR